MDSTSRGRRNIPNGIPRDCCRRN